LPKLRQFASPLLKAGAEGAAAPQQPSNSSVNPQIAIIDQYHIITAIPYNFYPLDKKLFV
jgi:hypothetical protein